MGGCDAFLAILPPTTVAVDLVNDGSFPVDVRLVYSDEQDLPELLLDEFGVDVELSIEPGSQRTFFRSCEDFQAMRIVDADLRIIGSLGPETSTDVLRDGQEFRCGETISFTFRHSDQLLDFDVSTTVR